MKKLALVLATIGAVLLALIFASRLLGAGSVRHTTMLPTAYNYVPLVARDWAAPYRAVWVWQSQVVTDPGSRTEFLDLARDKKLTAAYIYAQGLLPDQGLALQEFLTMADLEIEVLAGESHWALREHHDDVLSFVHAAVAFSQTLELGTNLVGVHLDVEPYTLPGWKADRANIVTQYLEMLGKCRQALDGSGLRLTVDIPVGFDAISAEYNGRADPLNRHVQDLADRVVLMDYRDQAEGCGQIIENALVEILYAMLIGRQVVIGVETRDIAPEWLTFYDEGEQVMEATLAVVRDTYSISPAFGGFAIHDYEGYRNLPLRLAECTPSGGTIDPSACIASVIVQINNEKPRSVAREEHILLQAGDTLKLDHLRFCASREALDERVAGEAYLFPNHVETYDYGIYSRCSYRMGAGCGEAMDFQGQWVMEPGQHRVLVALVHYSGSDYEVDDRFFINLDVA